jgi:hypothetical protein
MHSIEDLEAEFRKFNITFSRSQLKKNSNRIVVLYRVTAGRKFHTRISELLAANEAVVAFEV